MADDDAAAAINEGEATTTKVGYVKAFVTQSDWSGPVCQETWHGRHAPWCRVMVFLWLSCVASTYATIYSMTVSSLKKNIPLLKPRGDPHEERVFLARLKAWHTSCLGALCDQVGTLPLHCVVEGRTGRVEWDDDKVDEMDQDNENDNINDNGQERKTRNYEVHPQNKNWRIIPVPEACHAATDVMLGARLLEGQPLLTVKLNNETSSSEERTSIPENMDTLLTVLPSCELWINMHAVLPNKRRPPPGPQKAKPLPLLIMKEEGEDAFYPPGHVEHNVLQQWLCPAKMPEELSPFLQPYYRIFQIFLKYRHEFISGGVFLYYQLLQIYRYVTCILLMLVTTVVVRYVLPWPSSIGFVHTWKMLVLLSVLAMEPLLPIHPDDDEFVALLVPGSLAVVAALVYRDGQASFEWLWLGVLGWGAHSVISPWLESAIFHGHNDDFWEKIDGLCVFRIGTLVANLIVAGDGWWKCVTLYVWIRAYWPIYKEVQRQKQQRLDAQTRILNAYHMQQEQPPPAHQELQDHLVPPAQENQVNPALHETQMNLNHGTERTDDDATHHLKTE